MSKMAKALRTSEVVPEALHVVFHGVPSRWHPFYAHSEDVPCYVEYMRTAVCAMEAHADACEREYLALKTCFDRVGVST